MNPEPGTALARARDYGIDLTLLVRNFELTHEERAIAGFAAMQSFAELRLKAHVVNRP